MIYVDTWPRSIWTTYFMLPTLLLVAMTCFKFWIRRKEVHIERVCAVLGGRFSDFYQLIYGGEIGLKYGRSWLFKDVSLVTDTPICARWRAQVKFCFSLWFWPSNVCHCEVSVQRTTLFGIFSCSPLAFVALFLFSKSVDCRCLLSILLASCTGGVPPFVSSVPCLPFPFFSSIFFFAFCRLPHFLICFPGFVSGWFLSSISMFVNFAIRSISFFLSFLFIRVRVRVRVLIIYARLRNNKQ